MLSGESSQQGYSWYWAEADVISNHHKAPVARDVNHTVAETISRYISMQKIANIVGLSREKFLGAPKYHSLINHIATVVLPGGGTRK